MTFSSFAPLSSLLCLSLLAGGSAAAQSLITPDDTRQTVVAIALADGTLQSGGFLDLDDGTSTVNRPYDAARVGAELWFTDDVQGIITRWNSFGTQQLGEIDLSPQRLRGMTVAFGSVWVAGGNPSASQPDFLFELSPGGAVLQQYPMPGLISGIVALGPDLLVANNDSNDILRVDPATGAVTGVFHASNGVTGIDRPGDLHALPNGHLLAGGGNAPVGIYEYDAQGVQLNYYDTSTLPLGGGVRGVHATADGNIVFTAATAVYRYEVQTQQIVELIDSLTCYYISTVPSLPLGTPECGANPNSTGRPGSIQAFGSRVISDGALRLVASDLPNASTGYFLTSRQAGFVALPGGSQGNLCLAGPIGRYVSQIGFTAGDGFFSFTIDSASMPQPTGTVPTLAGETWRFQCWFRDANPTSTSNFTNATAVTFQ